MVSAPLPLPVDPLPAVVVGQTKPDGCDVPSEHVTFGEVGPEGATGVEGATGQTEVAGTEVPFQQGIIAGAELPPPVPAFCAQNSLPVGSFSTCWVSRHEIAEAGAAVMTAGTATSAVSPNMRAAKAAILRIVHLP